MSIFLNLYLIISTKKAATLCLSGCKLAPPIAYIFIHIAWLIGNNNFHYLRYKLGGDKIYCHKLINLKPVISDLCVSCCYLELYKQMNANLNTHMEDVVLVGYVVYEIMFIILDSLLANISFTVNSGVTTCIH